MTSKDAHAALKDLREAMLQPPRMYRVLLLNDDFTPMDFVVSVLERFFAKTREQATRIMLQVHQEGRGVCGVYAKDIAATKVAQVTALSREHRHPLACLMEEDR